MFFLVTAGKGEEPICFIKKKKKNWVFCSCYLPLQCTDCSSGSPPKELVIFIKLACFFRDNPTCIWQLIIFINLSLCHSFKEHFVLFWADFSAENLKVLVNWVPFSLMLYNLLYDCRRLIQKSAGDSGVR